MDLAWVVHDYVCVSVCYTPSALELFDTKAMLWVKLACHVLHDVQLYGTYNVHLKENLWMNRSLDSLLDAEFVTKTAWWAEKGC